jgi:hypothetical protein
MTCPADRQSNPDILVFEGGEAGRRAEKPSYLEHAPIPCISRDLRDELVCCYV